jgi:hypothetical protein
VAVTACGEDPDLQTTAAPKQAVTVPKHDPIEARPTTALTDFNEVRHERAAKYATIRHFVTTVQFVQILEQREQQRIELQRQEQERAATALFTERVAASREPESDRVLEAPAAVSPGSSGGIWYSLAQCESGGNWAINTGNGFYGGLQFTLSSWQAVGGSGYPHQASAGEQISRGQALQAIQGWGAWPACAAKLGLR